MTELQVVVPSSTTLLVDDNKEAVKATVRKLMRLAPGGRRLTIDQATDLALYSLMNDLNPFNGEAYFLPGVGPIPGVSGYRRKGNESLLAEGGPGSRFWCDFESAKDGTAVFDRNKGDIAYEAILHDSITKAKWESSTLGTFAELVKAGMETDEAWKEARKFIGPEPTWSAVGVVDHREKFAASGKPDRWDRHERCRKRAEKWAIRKRFPSTILPDLELNSEIIDVKFSEVDLKENPPRPEKELLAELGFDEPYSPPEGALEREKEQAEEKSEKKNGNGVVAPLVQALMDAKISDTITSASNILNLLDLPKDATTEYVVEKGKIYRAWKDSGKSTDEAAELTNKGEVVK